MRLVLQRVREAKVEVEGRVCGRIGAGWLVLVGVAQTDTQADVLQMVDKILNLRTFSDTQGKFNISALETNADLLVVSQFTLYGDCRKGRRPSFSRAAAPEKAKELYEALVQELRKSTNLRVETGEFQAHMQVSLVNDGPVTMLVDSKKEF